MVSLNFEESGHSSTRVERSSESLFAIIKNELIKS